VQISAKYKYTQFSSSAQYASKFFQNRQVCDTAGNIAPDSIFTGPGDVVKTNLTADAIVEWTAVLVYRWHYLKFATFHSLHVTVGVGEILDICPSWSVFPSQIFRWPGFIRLSYSYIMNKIL
jgi:hypothetical protein